MSRCGCGQGCSCRHIAVPPLHIEGNGSPSRPFEHSLEYNGQTGECALVAAVGARTGPGLRYNPPCELATYASADAGNTVGYGSDGGLYVPDPDNPLPPNLRCVRTLDWLSEQSFWHGGWLGGGANIAPYGSRSSIQHAVNQGLYMLRVRVEMTADGQPVFHNEADLSRVADYSPQAPAGTRVRDIGMQQARSITNRVSNWYGLSYEDEDGLPTLADVWDTYRDRLVWFLYVDPGDHDQLPALRDHILAWCMQDQVLVLTTYASVGGLTVMTDAGIPIAAHVTQANIDAGVTPQSVIDAGCTWAAMDRGMNPAHYADWASSELNVWGENVSSRVQADAAMTAGLRGVTSVDPPYTSRNNYTGPDQWWTNAMMSGQLSAATVLNSSYRREGVRGVKRPSGGWVFPAQSTIRGGTVLLGWAENTVSATYSWTFEMLFHQDADDIPNFGAGGLFFACPTDGPGAAWVPNDAASMWFGGNAVFPAANGYLGAFTSAGNLNLSKITNGVPTTLATAAPTDGPVVRSRVYKLRCEISGNNVRVIRLNPDDDAVISTAEAADAEFRGAYAHLYKFIGPTAAGWDVGFRDLSVSAPAVLAAAAVAGDGGGGADAGAPEPIDEGWQDTVRPIDPAAQQTTDPFEDDGPAIGLPVEGGE